MRRSVKRHTGRLLTLLLCAGLLGACGFQLRGTGAATTAIPDAWETLHLATGNPNSELSREVTSQFAASGVTWADRKHANFSVVLGPERFRQQNLSLNSEARAAELELTLSTSFRVLRANGSEAMPETEVAVVKVMENDPRREMGKSEERRLLQSEMRTELAQQILRRISFYAASTPTP